MDSLLSNTYFSGILLAVLGAYVLWFIKDAAKDVIKDNPNNTVIKYCNRNRRKSSLALLSLIVALAYIYNQASTYDISGNIVYKNKPVPKVKVIINSSKGAYSGSDGTFNIYNVELENETGMKISVDSLSYEVHELSKVQDYTPGGQHIVLTDKVKANQ